MMTSGEVMGEQTAPRPTLTIAIPTFNRRKKLQRLLEQIDAEILRVTDSSRIDVLVANNASTDDTMQFLGNFRPSHYRIRVINRPVDIGGCRNMEMMHREVLSEYLWIFGDDDMMLPGSIQRVIEVIDRCRPDLLRFSFMQPLGSSDRHFSYTEPLYITTDCEEIVRIVATSTKVSSYVGKNIYIPSSDPALCYAGGYGWVWLAWHYAVLQRAERPTVAVVSEALASCDEDENNDWLRFGFLIWSEWPKVFLHPFVARHAPQMLREQSDRIYRFWVHCYDLVRRGELGMSFFADLQQYGCRPPFQFSMLLADWHLMWCWVRGRIGAPWIYKVNGFMKGSWQRCRDIWGPHVDDR